MCGTERLSAKPGTAVPRKLAFFWQQKKACKENCRCCECSGPRLRGCTPPRPPIRKSEGPQATRTQYYCSRLTPVGLPPFLNSGVPPNPRRGRKAPLSKGAGRVSGLGDSDGLCVATRSRVAAAHLRGASGTPPPTMIWQGFSLPQTGTAAWGRPPYIPLFHSPRRGRACPARSLTIAAPLSFAS